MFILAANTAHIRNQDEHSMALSLYEQAQHVLQPATRILIVFHGSRSGDAIGSALALADFFSREDRHIDIVGVGTENAIDQ